MFKESSYAVKESVPYVNWSNVRVNGEILIARVVECRAPERVGSTARDGVDAGTRKSRLTHIEGGDYNLKFFNCFQAYRSNASLTTGRSSSTETEHVVEVCTVNLNVVVSVISTCHVAPNSVESL